MRGNNGGGMLWALAFALAPATSGAFPLDHLRTTDDIGPDKVPHEGVSHILVIPTRVGVETFPAERWNELRRLYDPAGGPGTFRGYWQAVSGGRYDPIPTLVEPVLYPDRCPIPDKPLDDCEISVTDARILAGGAVQQVFGDLFARVRDEQGVDLSRFDVNGAAGPGPDGWFDGVIIDSDMLSGVGFPLNAFNNAVTVTVAPGAPVPAPAPPDAGSMPDGGAPDAGRPDGGAPDGGRPDAAAGDAGPAVDAGGPAPDAGAPGRVIRLGNIAMVPPDVHEFGHLLGFIDLYNGPASNDVMGPYGGVTLSAFSRQQIGWGEVRPVEGPGTIDLRPVMDGGPILRLGEPPRYILIEHRGGPLHEAWDRSPPGIYIYSVVEDSLPRTRLGFLDLRAGDLYYPNAEPPYLNVNLPLGCRVFDLTPPRNCAAFLPGETRSLTHASGLSWGLHLRIERHLDDGAIRVAFVEGDLAPPVPDAAPPAPDAAPPDAGPAPGADAHLPGPAGTDRSERGGDGGCTSAGGPPLGGWLVALLALGLRRRSA